MDGLKSELLVGVCSPCVHEWHWKTTVCCPQATLSLLPVPSVDSGNGCSFVFYIPFLGGELGKHQVLVQARGAQIICFSMSSGVNSLYVSLACLLRLWSGTVASGSKRHHSMGLELKHWKNYLKAYWLLWLPQELSSKELLNLLCHRECFGAQMHVKSFIFFKVLHSVWSTEITAEDTAQGALSGCSFPLGSLWGCF